MVATATLGEVLLRDLVNNQCPGDKEEEEMKRVYLILALVLGMTLPHLPAFAQQEVSVDSYIELLRSDLRTQHAAIITQAMQFTEEEAAAFWPVYREYEADLRKLNDEKLLLIKDYLRNYHQMTDEKAKQLADRWFKWEKTSANFKKKYFKKFQKALPPITMARFMQVEYRILMLVDLQIASELPLIK